MFSKTPSQLPVLAALVSALAVAGCGGSSGTAAKQLAATSSCHYNADTSVAVTGNLNTLTDGDGSLQYAIIEAPQYGNVSVSSATGEYNYQATGTGRGELDQFRYQVVSDDGQSSSALVQIVNGRLRILTIGDSITYGVESYNVGTGDLPLNNSAVGYRKALYDTLIANGYAVDMVGPQSSGAAAGLASTGHAGFPGWTSSQMDDNVTSWLTAHTPDVALIHAGTNDHSSNASEVISMLNRADTWRTSNHDLSLLVAAIIQPRSDSPFSADPIAQFNQNVSTFMSSDGRFANDTVVDQFGALDRDADMTPQPADTTGLHPNTSGYAKMAQAWYDALVSSGSINKCST